MVFIGALTRQHSLQRSTPAAGAWTLLPERSSTWSTPPSRVRVRTTPLKPATVWELIASTRRGSYDGRSDRRPGTFTDDA
jgi:hypothetical protein